MLVTEDREPRSRVSPLPSEDHRCDDCGVVYQDLSVDRAMEKIARLPDRIRDAALAVPEPQCRQRPAPATWSVVEYVCHIRDVYVTYTIRLHRTRTEPQPVLEPMFNDLRARRFRYNARALEPVLDEISAAAAGMQDEIRTLSPDDWLRTATRLPGETRTALWLIRQATHEGVHHLRDIVAVGRRIQRA